ncbi:MAG: erythromycin esterase-like enzyme [Verrucomicrobiales bacterium]|nr:erythromycin esterase-like enzyme [Verrucomicrobiales bacterium]
MALLSSRRTIDTVRKFASPLTGASTDYDPLLELVGDAQFVLLGESTHGTHEFYNSRAEITKRLITEKGFNVIALEADWPDALRVNRYVRGGDQDETANEALSEFKRFPTWMWRNADMVGFMGWLRAHNATTRNHPAWSKVGVYGLDLYSLHASIDAVIRYLQKMDPEAAKEARVRYSCFEHFGEDAHSYRLTASQHKSLSCEDVVVEQLVEMQKRATDLLNRDGRAAADELFFAEQNALVARNAEKYYRAMYRGRPNTWNLRDTHMVDTLDRLMEHFRSQGEVPKAVVWAHNSHLGDARATQMTNRGEINVGQLMRERHGDKTVLVGFTTATGTVTAASDWGDPAERKQVREPLQDSYEELFHDVAIPNFLLTIRLNRTLYRALAPELLERAIGVIYRPETERWSHYFSSNIAEQFDAVIHFDETQAVEPLERTSQWDEGEYPETYPTAL